MGAVEVTGLGYPSRTNAFLSVSATLPAFSGAVQPCRSAFAEPFDPDN